METKLTYGEFDPEATAEIARALGVHPVVAGLIHSRGFTTPDAARLFLNPTFEHLTDPFRIKDMDKAVARIYSAVENREKILVFGDFDADGVTATTLVVEFLNIVDADVTWYIPHRLKEGYSIQPGHVDMAADMGVDLIITVDCGVSSHEAVEAANLEDIDIIITDHHEPGPDLPPALAVVDPKQPDCGSGLDFLAGVGVAFYLIMALRKFFRDKGGWQEIHEPGLVGFLDLFAIGTIGDMVPLVKENRVLCRAGIRQIRNSSRPGIVALARAARIDPGRFDSDDISFKLVPRINAAGRMSHARICVSLLTARTVAEAERTAALLDDLNLRRQTVEKEIVNQIELKVANDPALLDSRLLLLWDKTWNPSVLGIAASRLSKKYVCPVILISTAGVLATGSGRSINNINIHKALSDTAHLLERFGGHAMAAGLSLDPEHLPELGANLRDYLQIHYTNADFSKTLAIDAELSMEDISYDLACQLDGMRPFGTANPEPVFLARSLQVVSSHIIGQCHRKMLVRNHADPDGPVHEAFHFNVPDRDRLPDYFDKVAFKLKINKFKANTPQMIFENI